MLKVFNFNEFRKRNEKNREIEQKIKKLEIEKFYLERNIIDSRRECKHDLVAHFGKCHPNVQDTGYAICICCGEHFHLRLNEEIDLVNPRNVLDLTECVPDTYFYTMYQGENILVRKIREILLKTNGSKLPIDVLKDMLLCELIMYTQEMEEQSIKRVRNKENK